MITANRLPDVGDLGQLPDGFDMGGICYWKNEGAWYLYLPGGGVGNLTNHDVTEHDDGTITVSPSILVEAGRGRRHGFLRRGRWEPCPDDQPVEARG